MVKDQSDYFTVFNVNIQSYLVIAVRPSANLCDHTIHTDCADHSEAMDRAKRQHAGTCYSRKGDTKYFVVGMCRDASCECGGREARTDWWVDGVLHQWHNDPPTERKTYVQ
jgi:hypothetical protein